MTATTSPQCPRAPSRQGGARWVFANKSDLQIPHAPPYRAGARSLTPSATPRAFTLLELVLVLAIIAIAMLVAAPSLSSFVRGRSPTDAAAEFINLTHWVRSQSISDGVIMRINLDANNGHWWVTQQQGTDFIQSTATLAQDFTLPDGIHLDSDAPKDATTQYIEFDPSGQITPATVHLTGSGDPITITAESPLDLFHVASAKGSAT